MDKQIIERTEMIQERKHENSNRTIKLLLILTGYSKILELKDQIIDYIILQEVKSRRKNAATGWIDDRNTSNMITYNLKASSYLKLMARFIAESMKIGR